MKRIPKIEETAENFGISGGYRKFAIAIPLPTRKKAALKWHSLLGAVWPKPDFFDIGQVVGKCLLLCPCSCSLPPPFFPLPKFALTHRIPSIRPSSSPNAEDLRNQHMVQRPRPFKPQSPLTPSFFCNFGVPTFKLYVPLCTRLLAATENLQKMGISGTALRTPEDLRESAFYLMSGLILVSWVHIKICFLPPPPAKMSAYLVNFFVQ